MLIKPAQFLDKISGRFGNIVFNSGSGQPTARVMVVPRNPNTENQDAIRSLFAQLTKAWGTALSDNQRNAWNTWAGTNLVTNRFGNAVRMNGLSAFIQICTVRALMTGTTPSYAAPTSGIPASPLALNSWIRPGGTINNLNVTMPPTVPANTRLLFRVTPPIGSDGRNPPLESYVYIAGTNSESFKNAVANATNYSFADGILRFPVEPTNRVGVAVHVVSPDGRLSRPLARTINVTTT